MCTNGNFFSNVDYPVKMLDAGARICRVDMTFRAVRPQPEDDPDKWNWQPLEALAGRARSVSLPGLAGLAGVRRTVAAPQQNSGTNPNAMPLRGIEIMPVTAPGNLYGRYVYETVKRYHTIAHYWESWNEPDLPGHSFFFGNGAEFCPIRRRAIWRRSRPTRSARFCSPACVMGMWRAISSRTA